MSMAAVRAWWMRVRRAWDRMAVYLPLFLMSMMAMGTYWLVRNTPVIAPPEEAAPKRHVPDYFMKDFSVKVFNAEGKLKSEMFGVQGRHYPDTDTVEVDQPRIRSLNPQGQITVAVAKRGLINADGSEAQLFEGAEIVRERYVNSKGTVFPRSEIRSEFLHLFANTEKIKTHLPVEMTRDNGDHFTADWMDYDNLAQVMQLQGRVKGVIMPRPTTKKAP